MKHHDLPRNINDGKAFQLSGIIVICVILTMIFYLYYPDNFLYTYFLYIPLIIAGFWYLHIVLGIAVLGSVAIILLEAFRYGTMSPEALMRALIFIIAGVIIFFLADQKFWGRWQQVTATTGSAVEEVKKTQLHLQEQLDKLVLQNENMRQLISLSFKDALTGLHNRTYFEQEMRRLEAEHSEMVGLIICDIDGLKLVNDNLGHDAGDELLKNTAHILSQCFRENDLVARIGGDEFAVLITGTNPENLAKATRRLKQAISDFNSRHSKPPVSFSVGAAVKMDKNKSMTILFREADTNMYREKPGNRQKYSRVFEEYLSTQTSYAVIPTP